MTIELRRRINQEELAYAYEASRERMSIHLEFAEKCKKEIEKQPFYKSEKEALQAAIKLWEDSGRNSCYQIWASVEKVDNGYRLGDHWIIAHGWTKQAAEYIGMVLVFYI